jgi:hypothetical protein
MTTGPVDDLARMAALLGLRMPPQDLEREAPSIRALLADQETLSALPIDDLPPALTPWLPYDGPSAGE